MTEEAIKILKDFLKNPDDYFAQNYPHIPYKQGYLRGIETAENIVRNFYKLEQEEDR